MVWSPRPTGPLLHDFLNRLDQFFHGVVNDLRAGTAKPLLADHAFVVNEVNRRGAGQIPFLGDFAPSFARGRVAERPPSEILLFHEFLQGRGVRFTDVDADDSEWLAGEFLDERPLVRPHGPSGASVLVPEVEQHNLAAVVAQLELFAVLVLA